MKLIEWGIPLKPYNYLPGTPEAQRLHAVYRQGLSYELHPLIFSCHQAAVRAAFPSLATVEKARIRG